MPNKKSERRFTIQFNKKDPAHRQTADILNKLGWRGKAQFIANAVLYYASRVDVSEFHHSTTVDERRIEEVVWRLLRENHGGGLAAVPTPVVPAPAPVSQEEPPQQIQPAEEIILEDTVDALSKESLGAIAGALDMFKKK